MDTTLPTSPQTWRTFLEEYFLIQPKEKRDFVDALNVDERTFNGWITLGRNPRQPAIIFPVMARTLGGGSYRATLTALILEQFPELAPAMNEESVSISPAIPSDFYERIVEAYTNSSTITAPVAVLSLVMNQLVRQLDVTKKGVCAFVVKCVPPPARQKVEALTILKTFQSPFWKAAPPVMTSSFLGRESFLGMVMSTGQAETVNDIASSHLSLYPCPIREGSLAIYPVLKQGSFAGCLLLVSPEQGFFSADIRRGLLDKYGKLVVLAFRDSEFYQGSEIDLQVYSPAHIQLAYLQRFNENVITYLSLHPFSERAEAELAVLKEISQKSGE